MGTVAVEDVVGADETAQLQLDLVYIYNCPKIENPDRCMYFQILETFLSCSLEQNGPRNPKISLVGASRVSMHQLNEFLSTVERVCKLTKVPITSVELNWLEHGCMQDPKDPTITSIEEDFSWPEPSEALERTLLDLFEPLVMYGYIFSHYNLERRIQILFHGDDVGHRIAKFLQRLQQSVNSPSNTARAKVVLIKIEEMLSPYYGETEARLRRAFSAAFHDHKEGFLCICLDGVEFFAKGTREGDDLGRRLLATLLVLLDGIDRIYEVDYRATSTPSSRSTSANANANASTSANANVNASTRSLAIIATSRSPPEMLDDALVRPGRFDHSVDLNDVMIL